MELFNLTGKTALITGASSGLGEQFARLLSSQGVRVILASRRLDKLQTLSSELNNAVALEMDVADKTSVQRAFDRLEQQRELINICINNAGIAKLTPIFELDELDDFESVIKTNVVGVWYVSKMVANHMKNHEIHGTIINIASVNGENRLRENIAGYCASKASVIQMTKALVGELATAHIRINCIIPGIFHTPLTDYKLSTEKQRKELEELIPLHFVAEPTDLDGAILYLASNKASRYVTGSCITVDGGVSWGGK
ncbi:MAG: SDR family NAD(P)-dependent oxidoreductase [Candidatus Tisiphia sp.]|jgi:NAD(P)-dependent dehydrogenase (short-subunit alcohol dehydrogenase family)|uniref:SDR family NAD(P)-dependent oxidoreductase n=1 Tax=Candidatus Tisiphia endosymbiont of Melanophora roralis TaxID=3066261 RepID=UPI001E79564A|nr:MAG: SDR family oxidoreductase [Rickettsia endosymbiont of Cimex lectularius]